MLSLQFIRRRARATRNTQATLSVDWIWAEKKVKDWDADLDELDALEEGEGASRRGMRVAASQWQGRVDRTQNFSRRIVRLGKSRFRNDPDKLAQFEGLPTNGTSRNTIRLQGIAVRDAWQNTDPTWVPLKDENKDHVTLALFSTLLDECDTCDKQQSQKLHDWRVAAAALRQKAKTLDADNVAWYAEATAQFPAGTEFGDLLRRSIPTTSNPAEDVGPPVITNFIATGSTIHFDCSAANATRYTYFHQLPGAPDFQVLEVDTKQTSVTLHEQSPGTHRFKSFGSNAAGHGDESPVFEIELPAPAAPNDAPNGEATRSTTPVASQPGETATARSAPLVPLQSP